MATTLREKLNRLDPKRRKKIEARAAELIEIVRGSGNIWRDFGDPDADLRQAKSIIAAQIIGILDDNNLSTRQAAKMTGIDQSEFVRIRKPDLERFTIDRLTTILNKFDQHKETDDSA